VPSTQLRENVIAAARRVVVKVGSRLIATPHGESPDIDRRFIADLAGQMAGLQKRGYAVTLVSSGAVAAGCVELGLTQRPTDVATLQAAAAVGQRGLMTAWHDAFAAHDLRVGQVLLTRDDFEDRGRYLNLRNAVAALHGLGVVPVLNENDSVAVEEIRFGDNDQLAALMTNATRADALVLLTTVDGLLDAAGERVDLVEDVQAELTRLSTGLAAAASGGAGGAGDGGGGGWSLGGIASKLDAARRVTDAGEIAVIASGREPDVLPRLLGGEKLGTVFVPAGRKLDARRRWIGLTVRPAGKLTVDDGAVRALCERGKSLLATGITAVHGRFAGGDVVEVVGPTGTPIARGLSNYSDAELERIAGKRSEAYAEALGRAAYAEVIHRDNLMLIAPAG